MTPVNSSRIAPPEFPREWVLLYRLDELDEGSLQRAYGRFVARRRQVVRAMPFRWWLIALILGASATGAYAATGVVRRLVMMGDNTSAVPTRTASSPPKRIVSAKHGSVQRQHLRAPLPETSSIPSGSDAQETEAVAEEFEPQSPRVTSNPAGSARKPVRETRKPETYRPLLPPVPDESAWERAARGLRDGDFRAADLALSEIEATGSVRERESAQLSRAQLLVATGRRLQAIALVRELSQKTQSLSTRKKTHDLLTRLEQGNFQPRESR